MTNYETLRFFIFIFCPNKTCPAWIQLDAWWTHVWNRRGKKSPKVKGGSHLWTHAGQTRDTQISYVGHIQVASLYKFSRPWHWMLLLCKLFQKISTQQECFQKLYLMLPVISIYCFYDLNLFQNISTQDEMFSRKFFVSPLELLSLNAGVRLRTFASHLNLPIPCSIRNNCSCCIVNTIILHSPWD